LLFIVVSVFIKSYGRTSVLGSSSALNKNPQLETGLGVKQKDSSSLQFQQFHRIEVKDGKVIWEVKAKEAKYLVSEGVTHINDSLLSFYKSDGTKIAITSKAARLYAEELGVRKAELEGDVLVRIGEQFEVRSDLAIYDSEKNTILMPEMLAIQGEGFKIEGKNLVVDVEDQHLEIQENVFSRFIPGSSFPKGTDFK